MTKIMTYSAGQIVRHRTLGLGKILKVETSGSEIRVFAFFKDRPDIRNPIRADMVPLEVLNNYSDGWLDNLDIAVIERGKVAEYMTHDAAIHKFVDFFPLGFADPKFFAHERNYKLAAHDLWNSTLNRNEFEKLMAEENFSEIASRAMGVERVSKNFIATFEKMALHEAVKQPEGQRPFSIALFDLIYGSDSFEPRFNRFSEMLGILPQRKSKTLTWPIQTLFPFLALPQEHLFLKPEVAQMAAKRRAFSLNYQSQPNWLTYSCWLTFGQLLMRDLSDLKPHDMIDIQSFIWMTGDANYS